MSLFDKDLALSQAGGNAELAKELFEMLLKDLPSQQKAMNQAHSEKNKQPFWDIIHKIYGGTAYCGVSDLKDSCKQLEDEIKNAYPNNAIAQPLDNVNKEIERLLKNADDLMASL